MIDDFCLCCCWQTCLFLRRLTSYGFGRPTIYCSRAVGRPSAAHRQALDKASVAPPRIDAEPSPRIFRRLGRKFSTLIISYLQREETRRNQKAEGVKIKVVSLQHEIIPYSFLLPHPPIYHHPKTTHTKCLEHLIYR